MEHQKLKANENLDVDIRFLLANERTLLAWIRTGLTLIAGGVAVAFISADSDYGMIAGIGAIGFGGVLSMIGYYRYLSVDSALRTGHHPKTGVGGILAVFGVIIFAVAIIIVRNLKIV